MVKQEKRLVTIDSDVIHDITKSSNDKELTIDENFHDETRPILLKKDVLESDEVIPETKRSDSVDDKLEEGLVDELGKYRFILRFYNFRFKLSIW